MSPPIYTPDGSEVSEIVLPDGSTASEVIGPDGTVVFEAGPDIPDSEVYLYDDWGDNKLTNRDDSGTTTYNGVQGVYRPEWTTVAGAPEAVNQSLHLQSPDAIAADINLNLNETVTWTWSNVDGSGGSGDDQDQYGLVCFSETTILGQAIGSNSFERSYFVALRDDAAGDLFRLYRVNNDGTTDLLIEDDKPTDGADITVTRSASGVWELLLNETSAGTVTDTTFTDPLYTGFCTRSTENNTDVTVDEVKVN